ncbi:MAG: NAD(P)/FAD-dependent oxidoreductase, partial [Candidatus Acidiferrales bacterium]
MAIAGAGGLVGAEGMNVLAPVLLPEEMVFETNRSHWSKALPTADLSLQADIEADVAIVGGGFTGLSSAYYLRKNSPSKRVVLLEAKSCGNGASGRNGAMVLTLTEDRYMEMDSDLALDKKIYDLTAGNIHRLREIAASVGIDCELETNGALQVCNTAEYATRGRKYV